MNKTKEAGIIKNINHKKAPPNNAIPPKNTKTVASITIHGKTNLLNLLNLKQNNRDILQQKKII